MLIRWIWVIGLAAVLILIHPPNLFAETLVLEAEVMEGSQGMVVPGMGFSEMRYAIVHHNHERDQAAFSGWLRGHQSGVVKFVASDGSTHQGMLHRLKHCFGRGLLLFTTSISLAEKAVIRLELPVAP